jgi:tetratricopeptide (TPR) repeat protein
MHCYTGWLLCLAALLLAACKPAPVPEPQAPRALSHADSLLKGDLYFEAGVMQYGLGNLDSALTLFNTALGFDSASAKGWHSKGSTLGRQMRHAEAQAAFREALRLRPAYVSAWWHKGCDNAVAWRVDSALADLAHAIALDSAVKTWPFGDDCWLNLRTDERLLRLTAPYTMEHSGTAP